MDTPNSHINTVAVLIKAIPRPYPDAELECLLSLLDDFKRMAKLNLGVLAEWIIEETKFIIELKKRATGKKPTEKPARLVASAVERMKTQRGRKTSKAFDDTRKRASIFEHFIRDHISCKQYEVDRLLAATPGDKALEEERGEKLELLTEAVDGMDVVLQHLRALMNTDILFDPMLRDTIKAKVHRMPATEDPKEVDGFSIWLLGQLDE